ncbi:MAG: 1-acyl-sn-glycerol-3-phosphate acyltransferase [Nanoarchaeota archaeon]
MKISKRWSRPNKPIIIMINHQSRFDWFVLFLLDWNIVSNFLPIRVMISHNEYYKPHLFPLLFALGGYPIKKFGSSLDDLLNPTYEMLKNKQTILIFPEGRIIRRTNPIIQKGAIRLIRKHKDASIVPIRIAGLKNKSLFDIFTKISLKITLGKPMGCREVITGNSDKKLSKKIISLIYFPK